MYDETNSTPSQSKRHHECTHEGDVIKEHVEEHPRDKRKSIGSLEACEDTKEEEKEENQIPSEVQSTFGIVGERKEVEESSLENVQSIEHPEQHVYDEISMPKSESQSPEISEWFLVGQSPDLLAVEELESLEDEEDDVINLEELSEVASGFTVSSTHTILEKISEVEEEDEDESEREIAL